jgi:hypothetical protein
MLNPDVVLKGDAMTSRGDCPIPSTSSHTIRTTEVCSLSQRKNSPGSPNLSRSRRRGIAPMKDLKIMADDLNVPTEGGRVFILWQIFL